MNTGAGWLSLGPGYRQYFMNDQMFVDGSGAVSWHLYKMVQGRIEAPSLADDHLTVGAQVMWQDQTQVDYFGRGPDAFEGDESQYRIKTTEVVGYATWRLAGSVSVTGELGWIDRPTIDSPTGTFRSDVPDTRVAFPGQPGATDEFQPNFLRGEAAVYADTRDHRGHPTSGGVYGGAVTTFRDQATGLFSFNEYEAEALHFIPLADRNWVLAFRGWTVLTDVPSGHEVPFYLQPSIGGHNTIRAYDSYRFHDLNTLVVNAESRWALYEHVDLAAFFDAGNVAPRAEDLNLDKTAYGGGIRVHVSDTTVARLDIAHGDEGWMFVLRTNDPFRLSRISRRIARVPFAP
jgi:hypothetical protein